METYAFPKVTELAIPLFIAAVLLELFLVATKRARGSFNTADTMTSLAMGVGNVVAGLLVGFISISVLMWVWQYRFFDQGMAPWVFVVAFLVDDLRYYWYHRIAHRVRWVWAEHVNHHSSQHYNLSTALRQSWTGHLTGMVILQAPLVLLGFHPALIAFVYGFNLLWLTLIPAVYALLRAMLLLEAGRYDDPTELAVADRPFKAAALVFGLMMIVLWWMVRAG